MRIEFIEQTPIQYLVHMPYESEEELEKIETDFADLISFKAATQYLEILNAEDGDDQTSNTPEQTNDDVPEFLQGLDPQASLEKLAEMAQKTLAEVDEIYVNQTLETEMALVREITNSVAYEYKVNMFTDFLPELLQAQEDIKDEKERAEFVMQLQKIQKALTLQNEDLTSDQQKDLTDAWERVCQIGAKEFDLFYYIA